MKVLVLGSGVIGTSVAYYLARDGHEVQVLDRQDGPALETSFANAGEVSPGYSAPWAGPGVPVKAIKWMLMQHSPLVIWPLLDPAMWRWGATMLANCTRTRLRAEQEPHGADRRIQPRLPEGAARRDRHQPTTSARRARCSCFARRSSSTASAATSRCCKQYGVPYEVLDRDGFVKVEPALALTQHKFVGALRLPGDETGDCFKFSNRLAEMAQALGVSFRWRTHDPLAGAAGRADQRRAHRCRSDAGRPLRAGAGQLVAAAAAAAGPAHPGVSGEGLLDHRADQRCRRSRPNRPSWTRRTRWR